MVASFSPTEHALAGALSSIAFATLLHPLGIAVTRSQVESRTVWLSEIFATEGGLTGIFCGVEATLVATGASQFTFFFVWEILKRRVSELANGGKGLTLTQDLLVGFVAGVVNQTLSNPLWVAANEMKLAPVEDVMLIEQGEAQQFVKKRKNYVEVVRSILASPSGGFQGLDTGVLLCTNPAIFYGVGEQLKRGVLAMMNRQSQITPGKGVRKLHVTLTPGTAFVVAALAKALATVITYPLQIIQANSMHTGSTMSSSAARLISKYRWQLHLYFWGLEKKLAMTVLNSALMFAGKEWFLRNVALVKRLLLK